MGYKIWIMSQKRGLVGNVYYPLLLLLLLLFNVERVLSIFHKTDLVFSVPVLEL